MRTVRKVGMLIGVRVSYHAGERQQTDLTMPNGSYRYHSPSQKAAARLVFILHARSKRYLLLSRMGACVYYRTIPPWKTVHHYSEWLLDGFGSD